MIALQKPVRPATGGEPAGAPLFLYFGDGAHAKGFFELCSADRKIEKCVNGKNDLFSVVIALRYMLNDQWYKELINELKALIDKYLKKHDSISEQELYEKMGFSENWRKITRYRKQ